MRTSSYLSIVAALVLTACTSGKQPPTDAAESVAGVREALALREKKVESYRYSGVTTRGNEKAEFKFSFRAPNKMRAELISANRFFFFDGTRLLQWDATNEKMTEFDLESATKEKRADLLHRIFSPFVPEGWRAPLLGGTLRAEKRKEGEKTLTAVIASVAEGEQAFEITWLFEPPAMNFAGKQVKDGGVVRVLDQHCDRELGVCFPSTIEEEIPGEPVTRTVLKEIELNVPMPPELFEIHPPSNIVYEKAQLE